MDEQLPTTKLQLDGPGPFSIPPLAQPIRLVLAGEDTVIIEGGLPGTDRRIQVPLVLDDAMKLMAMLEKLRIALDLPVPEGRIAERHIQ
jgi:hypothetical protein